MLTLCFYVCMYVTLFASSICLPNVRPHCASSIAVSICVLTLRPQFASSMCVLNCCPKCASSMCVLTVRPHCASSIFVLNIKDTRFYFFFQHIYIYNTQIYVHTYMFVHISQKVFVIVQCLPSKGESVGPKIVA